MSSAPDLSRAVQFDLSSGAVRLDGDPSVVLSTKAFGALLAAAPPSARSLVGSEIGDVMGARIAARRGGTDGVRAASLEDVVLELASELALAGFGTVALERWGRALVLLFTAPTFDAPELYTALAARVVSRATGGNAEGQLLSKDGGVRVLLASAHGAMRVRGWLNQSVPWAEALVRLQGGAS